MLNRRFTAAWILGAFVATACLGVLPTSIPSASRPPSSSVPTDVVDDWSTLRRPLTVPAVGSDPQCRPSGGRKIASGVAEALGEGPVYPVGLGATGHLSLAEAAKRDDIFYWKVLWISGPTYHGRVLIRGVRLSNGGAVLFGAGDVFGWPELRLPVEAWATSPDVEAGWRMWPSYTGTPSAGCFAYQVDGEDFTAHVIFEIGP